MISDIMYNHTPRHLFPIHCDKSFGVPHNRLSAVAKNNLEKQGL